MQTSLLAGGWEPLLQAAIANPSAQQQPVLLAAADSIPHLLLLPECSAVVHHGGAGTSAAALVAGLPQIICPFHFDQFSWVSHTTSSTEPLYWYDVARHDLVVCQCCPLA